MTINIEEKIELETWELLQQLKRDFILTPNDQYVTYEIIEYKNIKQYPDQDNQRKIIYKLEHSGILKIVRRHFLNPRGSFLDTASMSFELQGAKPQGFLLNIIEDKFNSMFSEYEKKYSKNITNEIKALDFYIIKQGDDFYYKGKLLPLSKDSDYYKVFCALYALLPSGGDIDYDQIGDEVKSRIEKTKTYTKPQMRKLILMNLTDKNNGFFHYAGIPNTEDNSKKLISTNRGKGIHFNNRAG